MDTLGGFENSRTALREQVDLTLLVPEQHELLELAWYARTVSSC